MGNVNKNIDELINQIKEKIEPTNDQLETVKKFAEEYSTKSSDEIMMEIIKLNKKLTENMGHEEFSQKLKQLEALRPLLSKEQNENLDRILEVLKSKQ